MVKDPGGYDSKCEPLIEAICRAICSLRGIDPDGPHKVIMVEKAKGMDKRGRIELVGKAWEFERNLAWQALGFYRQSIGVER